MNFPPAVLAHLKLLGAHGLRVDFDGSGDSGDINDVSVFGRDFVHINIENQTFPWDQGGEHFDNALGSWVKNAEKMETLSLDQVLREITQELLGETHLDWYNNDGGFGELMVDLMTSPPEIKLNVSIRTVNTEDHTFVIEATDAPTPPLADVG